MKINLKNSIGLRLLKVVFGCYLISTVIVTTIQLYLEYSSVEKEILAELYNVSHSFEDGIAISLWNIDTVAMESIIRGIVKNNIVSGVLVEDHKGEIQAFYGSFVGNIAKSDSKRVVQFNGKEARKLILEIDNKNTTLYEVSLDIIYVQDQDAKPELVGKIYLYASKDMVVERFSYSFLLIIVNALIKTACLWVIFLVATKKMIAQPLELLTQATRNLHKNTKKDIYVEEVLKDISRSKHKDELHILADSFEKMHSSIVKKMSNLNQLNNFSIKLARTQSILGVYENIDKFVKEMFGCQQACTLQGGNEIHWLNSDSHNGELSMYHNMDLSNIYLDDVRSNTPPIVYSHQNESHIHDLSEEASNNIKSVPFLYLPLQVNDNNTVEILFFGAINSAYLNREFNLTHEAEGFLSILSSMANETIKNITQGEIIQKHNQILEKRVFERTKELEKLNQELEYLAVHDPLTGLPNRILFKDRLDYLIKYSNRHNVYFSVLNIDLTKFKDINDTYGHEAGDIVLKAVATRFSKELRKTDTISRVGGDEFSGIIINNGPNSIDSIKKVVDGLNKSLEKEIPIDSDNSVLIGANIGVAFFPEHAMDGELLVKYSDIAMYDAKRSYKQYAVFNPEKNLEVKESLQFIYELEHAVSRNQLELYYQPIVDLKTRQPISFEALVRWNHPEQGVLQPAQFIPHAEKSGLIMPLTEWVVKEASKQCMAWQTGGYDFTVSINISARLFTTGSLSNLLREIVKKYQLEPSKIKLEITETTAMEQPETGMKVISKLSEMGFLISIDDFGTGHSSLSYLTQFPINELKIDRSFIINESDNSIIVIQTIIELARALDLFVVAEGIESEERLNMLLDKGCHAAQGYYICKPNKPSVIKEWLDTLKAL